MARSNSKFDFPSICLSSSVRGDLKTHLQKKVKFYEGKEFYVEEEKWAGVLSKIILLKGQSSTGSIGISYELVRHAESQAQPHTF